MTVPADSNESVAAPCAEGWISVAQVAAKLDVSLPYASMLVRHGKLGEIVSLQDGKSQVAAKAVDTYLAEHKREPTSLAELQEQAMAAGMYDIPEENLSVSRTGASETVVSGKSGLVFLDFDDVLCLNRPYGGYDVATPNPPQDLWQELFHAPAVELLRDVALKYEPRFVLTTSWLRILDWHSLASVLRNTGLDAVADRLHRHCEALQNRGQSRQAAIAMWLVEHHEGEPFVILDDHLSGTGLQGSDFDSADRVVLCDVNVGLKDSHLPDIVRALSARPGRKYRDGD